MVNRILPTSIIKDFPEIRYKPFLEYLDGEDIFAISSKNEQKHFLQQNLLYNDELAKLNDHVVKFKPSQIPIIANQTLVRDIPDYALFEKYGNIRCWFDVLDISYDLLYSKNGKSIFTTAGSEFDIIPVNYGDFYADIDLKHILTDYNSFSTIIDYTKGVIYINDIVLDYLKNCQTAISIMCCVLANVLKYDQHDSFYALENQTRYGKLMVKRMKQTYQPEVFKLDYLPATIQYSTISNVQSFMTEDNEFCLSISNIPYSIYSKFITRMNGTLYYNNDLGFFSEDKNRTAINVLAYDLCQNGFLKPIVINKDNGKFVVQSKTRFLIAQYLKLPTIPAIIYSHVKGKNNQIAAINIFEDGQQIELPDIQELKDVIYPDLIGSNKGLPVW